MCMTTTLKFQNNTEGTGTTTIQSSITNDSITVNLPNESGQLQLTSDNIGWDRIVDIPPNLPMSLVIASTPSWYKRRDLPVVSKTQITILSNTQINIENEGYISTQDVVLNVDSVGTASTRAGKDVYVYACKPATGSEPVFVLSFNSTVPSGYTAENSRKIGGFHCLCNSVGTISDHTLNGYNTGDILPLSVWDLLHRPISDPEGMVWIEGIGKWVDIYLASWNGTKLISSYNSTIADSSSSKAFNGDMFAEYAGLVGKSLVKRDEFIVFAKGSNEETNIAGSTDPNTTGGHVDTTRRRMISNYGIEDCCGVLWQWSADVFDCFNSNGVGWNTDNFYLSGYSWRQKSVYNPSIDSRSYGSCCGLLRRARLGAHWSDGSLCGSRCAYLNAFSSVGWTDCAVRLSSEPRVAVF